MRKVKRHAQGWKVGVGASDAATYTILPASSIPRATSLIGREFYALKEVAMQTFSDFVLRSSATKPDLPLLRYDDGYALSLLINHHEIREVDEICDVYGEPLLYFFYGRCSFRPSHGDDPIHNADYAPICLAVDPKLTPKPVRVLPFDSGALHGGLYKDFMHNRMDITDFELPNEISSAAKVVETFFGSRENYLVGRAKESLAHDPMSFHVARFLSLIRSASDQRADERRMTVEVQFHNPLPLSNGLITHIACPTEFSDDADFEGWIKKNNIKPIFYEFVRSWRMDAYKQRFAELVQSICGMR